MINSSFKEIIFIYTYKCNAICAHCGSNCSPMRSEKLTVPKTKECLELISNLDIKIFTISGGEPLLFFEEMQELFCYAFHLGLKFNLGTNGFWANEYKKTYEIISMLKTLGISTLLLSVDKYHQQFIELENILNIVNAAEKIGVKVKITINTIRDDVEGQKLISKLLSELIDKNCFISIKEPKLIGRAKNIISDSKLTTVPLEHPKMQGPCELIKYPAILPDGKVIACCTIATELAKSCNPLFLGNIFETPLNEILEHAEQDLLLKFLLEKGPFTLIEIFELSGASYKKRDKYHERCELCLDLMENQNINLIKLKI
jgi:MoaA/NifB/PqqE/SkfB family radical SAM enzyme